MCWGVELRNQAEDRKGDQVLGGPCGLAEAGASGGRGPNGNSQQAGNCHPVTEHSALSKAQGAAR